MVAFTIGRPVTTDVPGIEVDGLPAGSHRFQLVVVDDDGMRSQPDQIVVLVRDRVLTPIDPPIVRPPIGGPAVDPVQPPVTGPVIGPVRPPVTGPVIAGPVIAGPVVSPVRPVVTGPVVSPVRPVVAGPLVSPLVVRAAGPVPPPPKPASAEAPTPAKPARKSKRRKP
jgi:hypothetical protein